MSYTPPLLPDGSPYPYVQYLREENGSLHETFSQQPPGPIPAGMVEIDEATYLRELQVLEDLIEDHTRELLHGDAERQARVFAAFRGMDLSADDAAVLSGGHDPDQHGARLAAAVEYVDPKRRTTRAA